MTEIGQVKPERDVPTRLELAPLFVPGALAMSFGLALMLSPSFAHWLADVLIGGGGTYFGYFMIGSGAALLALLASGRLVLPADGQAAAGLGALSGGGLLAFGQDTLAGMSPNTTPVDVWRIVGGAVFTGVGLCFLGWAYMLADVFRRPAR